jgi:adenylate kinase
MRMVGKVIVLTGIPGVGKTTVVDELLRIAKEQGKKVSAVNFGTTMMEVARKEGNVKNRDELRKSAVEFQKRIQIEAAKAIAGQVKEGGIVLVDTHMIIRTEEGYYPGIPQDVINVLRPSSYVLVETDPKEILARRSKDKTRSRDMILAQEIESELQLSRAAAMACAVATGTPVKIVQNPPGKQAQAAKELLPLL